MNTIDPGNMLKLGLERGVQTGTKEEKHAAIGLLPLARPRLPNFLLPPKATLAAGAKPLTQEP